MNVLLGDFIHVANDLTDIVCATVPLGKSSSSVMAADAAERAAVLVVLMARRLPELNEPA